MNPLYEDDIENELQQNIHDIKHKNKNIQTKLNFEQIEIEYIYYVTQVLKPMELK
jgi:hypothetical protein